MRKFYYRLIVCLINVLLLTQYHPGMAQDLAFFPPPFLSVQEDKQNELKVVLHSLEDKFGVFFTFETELIRDKYVEGEIKITENLEESLDNVLAPLDLNFKKIADKYYTIFRKKEEGSKNKKDTKRSARRQRLNHTNEPSWIIPVTPALKELAINVSGTVTNESRMTLPGVNVIEKGTTNGTATDAEGKYSLDVPDEGAVLVFSFIGFTTMEVPVNGRTVIDVTLAQDMQRLQEVVVVGYGTQRKREVTAAISSIKSEDLQKVASNSFTSAIQGKVPGVFISQTSGAPGSASSVRIRGVGTTGGNQPLYVVDGLPMSGGGMSIAGSTDQVDALSIVNPNDIESIEILKDAAAASIYGARAANGVVIITTKRGKTGQAQVNFNAYTGIQQLWRKPQFLNAEEFATMANEVYNNSGMTPNPEWANPSSLGKGTNWIDEVFRNAPVQNYDFSARGGTDKLKAAISLGYLDQEGTMLETNYKRYTGRFSADLAAHEKLRFGGSLAFTYTQAQGQRNQLMNYGIFNLAQQFYPTLGTDDIINGSSAYYTTQADNPILRARSIDNQLKNLRAYGNIFGEFEIISGLKFKTNLGIDAITNRSTTWEPTADRGFYRNLQATLGETYTQGLTWLIENTLLYSKSFGDHRIDAIAGQTSQKSYTNWISATGINFLNETMQVINGSEASLRKAAGTNSYYTLASYLGRVNYSFKEKYLLSASIRRDGSSNFGPNYKWGNFPSVSAGWNISEEGFLKEFTFLDELKIRASWGQLGNDAIGAFGYLSTIRSGTPSDNYVLGTNQSIMTGASMSRPGNSDLKWETSEQIDIGIDASFFQARVYMTADYYIKNTKDMLVNLPVSIEAGFQFAPPVNGGQVQNKGFELLLGTRGEMGDFHYDISSNISFLKNEVISLGVGQPITGPTITFTGMSASYTEVGQPIGYYRGYIVDGIYQTDEEVNENIQPNAIAGDFRYRDINGDDQLTDIDKVNIGKPWPDMMYGVNFDLGYKNFDFNLMLQGIGGNEIFHSNKSAIYPIKYFGGAGVVNGVKNVLNRWTPGSGRNDVPGLKYTDSNGNYSTVSTFFVEDGDYMRIRNVVLGYKILSNKKFIQKVRVYVSAQNLFTFTDYSGFDPEVGSTNPLMAGIDDGVYPLPRTFLAGVNVTF